MATSELKAFTYRVEGIPKGTTAAQLKRNFFYTEDQEDLTVRSLCPSVESVEGKEERDLTATVFFRPRVPRPDGPRVQDRRIGVDKDFTGFTPLYVPPIGTEIAADIIAVTGLAGHAYGSWAYDDDEMWLRDYLMDYAPDARILTYGYTSKIKDGPFSILHDHTARFVNALVTMRHDGQCQSRPIIFIGHSLGCLIIKKALIETGSIGVYASRLPVRAILFLAAPHKGINVEALETLVNGRPSQMMIAELRTGSPTLLDLNAKFAEVAYGIEIHSFFETMETPTVRQNENGILSRSGQAVTMVDRDSACLYCLGEHCHSVDANHSQIAKIKKGQAGIFPQVKSAIQSALIPTAHIVAKDYPEPSRDYSYYGVPQWMPPPPVYSLNKRTSFYSNISATQSAWGLQPRYPDGYSERASSPMHFAAESQPQRQIRTPSFGPTSGPEQFPTYAPNRLSTPAIETGDGLPKSVATSEAAEGIDREVFRPEPRGREISSTSTEDYAIPLIVTPDECEAAPKERSLSSKASLSSDEAFEPIRNGDSDLAASDEKGDEAVCDPTTEQVCSDDTALAASDEKDEEAVCDPTTESVYSGDTALVASDEKGEEAVCDPTTEPVCSEDTAPLVSDEKADEAASDPTTEQVRSNDTALVVSDEKGDEAASDPSPFASCHNCNQPIPESEPHYGCRTCFADTDDKKWWCSSCFGKSSCPMSRFAVINCSGQRHSVLYVDDQVSEDDTSIRKAIKQDDIGALTLAIRRQELSTSDNETKSKYLHLAAKLGRSKCVGVLLKAGVSKESRDASGHTPLLLAVDYNHLDMVRMLLMEYYVDVDSSSNGRTALAVAVKNGQAEMVSLLLDNDAKIEVEDGPALLVEAASKGDERITELLLKAGAEIDMKEKGSKHCALFKAASEGHEHIVKLLISGKANVNAVDDDDITPLSKSCENGSTSITRLLLEAGADVQTASWSSNTPLHNAVRNGHVDCVNLLLEQGADVEAETRSGLTALLIAAEKGHEQICQHLLDAKADMEAMNESNDHTALLSAFSNDHVGIVKLLLDHGANIEARDDSGYTCLQWAAERGNLEVCEALVNKNADLNSATKRWTGDVGMTPLHLATKNDRGPVVDFLLSHGIKVDARDSNDRTSLHWAAEKGHLGICESLLTHRASTYLRDDDERTPLYIAVREGHSDVVKLLLENGANPEQRCGGLFPLYKAARLGHMESVKLLVEKNADLEMETTGKDNWGWNAVSGAAFEGHLDVIKYLLEKGASGAPPSGCSGKWKRLRFSSETSYETDKQVLKVLREAKHR